MKRSTSGTWTGVLCGLWVLAGLAIAPIAVAADDAAVNEGLQITIMMFSGRENPTFVVSDASELQAVMGSLREARTVVDRDGTVLPSRLGYAGLILDNVGEVSGLPQQLRVYRNQIELRDETVTFAEDDGALERTVLQYAVAHEALDDEMLKFIRADD
jgi:hypothetical protein